MLVSFSPAALRKVSWVYSNVLTTYYSSLAEFHPNSGMETNYFSQNICSNCCPVHAEYLKFSMSFPPRNTFSSSPNPEQTTLLVPFQLKRISKDNTVLRDSLNYFPIEYCFPKISFDSPETTKILDTGKHLYPFPKNTETIGSTIVNSKSNENITHCK